jgi:predicted ester cyclase
MPDRKVEENIAITRRWFEEVWNQQRSATIRELVLPDCITHGTHEAGGDVHGPEGFEVFHARFIDAFPDIRIDIQDCFGAGEKVAVRWIATMHHRGRGLGIEPTNAEISVGGTSIARFSNGKIAESWDNYDKQSMFQQIEAAAQKAKATTA